MKDEIIIYQPGESLSLEVRLEEDTVWLSQTQMVELFESSKQNISLHINNVFKEGELNKDSTVKEYLTVQKEGNRTVSRKIKIYNLDVIISVGYRVKSKRGTQFRIWANKVIKDYLLKGYAINNRINRIIASASYGVSRRHTVAVYGQSSYEYDGFIPFASIHMLAGVFQSQTEY